MSENNGCAGIAIVDDEPDVIEAYKKIIARRGIRVCFVATSGIDAIRMFKSSTPKPYLVIMDQRLPAMSGIEAMKLIKKESPSTRIIFISADPAVEETALKAGADIYIHKPASLKTINHAIDAMI